MKIFDLHADIGYHLYQQNKLGDENALQNTHIPKLLHGEVQYSAVACYFLGSESWQEMQAMISNAKKAIEAVAATFILQADDLEHPKSINFILTVEGMCGIKNQVEEKIQWMYDQGVRIASLTWNDENALATGVNGNKERGLSEQGVRAIKKMNELNMIIDVSHTNEKTFWDILRESSKPVLATHSNLYELVAVKRNLTKQQFQALAKMGGIVGLNACGKFIDEHKENQDAYHLAKQAQAMKEYADVHAIALGFDFMDFLDEKSSEAMAKDLKSAKDAQNIIVALKNFFTEEEIEKIAYKNVIKFLKRNL